MAQCRLAKSDFCLERDCSYIFYVDSEARIDNPHTLKLLMDQNRRVVAPMLPRPGKAWSNFWGALTADGFYARSDVYILIIQNERRGLWNVPYVGSSFLLRRDLLEDPKTKPFFINNMLDPDMALCQNLRDQPCPDVYWFPIFKERYAKEMIELMESYGQWSDGSHMDKRLEGGYETVPTVEIHMNHVNYNDEWLEILRAYVQLLQLRVCDGYYNDVGVRPVPVEGTTLNTRHS